MHIPGSITLPMIFLVKLATMDNTIVFKFCLTLFILLPLNSYALNPADLEMGEEINEVCAGCHGEYAEGGKDGEYPRLAGLPVKYIERQLHLFRDRKRPNMPMVQYVDERQTPDQEILDISTYLNKITLLTKLPPAKEGEEFDAYERMLLTKQMLNIARVEGDHEAGKKLYKRECRSCHGRSGEGDEEKAVPMLTGQYTKYLKKQVKMFKDKQRIHDPDAPDEEFLSLFTEEQLHNIFAYLSIVDDE